MKEDKYKYLEIEPSILINRIITNPRASEEYYSLVKNLCSANGLKNVKVQKSKMFNDSKEIIERFLSKLPNV